MLYSRRGGGQFSCPRFGESFGKLLRLALAGIDGGLMVPDGRPSFRVRDGPVHLYYVDVFARTCC